MSVGNLLIEIISAKSSISIFSNCVAAPYSGVITYKEMSECSNISVDPSKKKTGGALLGDRITSISC